jgi:hypothetical protein
MGRILPFMLLAFTAVGLLLVISFFYDPDEPLFGVSQEINHELD